MAKKFIALLLLIASLLLFFSPVAAEEGEIVHVPGWGGPGPIGGWSCYCPAPYGGNCGCAIRPPK